MSYQAIQHMLDVFLTGVEVTTFGYIAVGFAAHAWKRAGQDMNQQATAVMLQSTPMKALPPATTPEITHLLPQAEPVSTLQAEATPSIAASLDE